MSEYDVLDARGHDILAIFGERQRSAWSEATVDLEELLTVRDKPGGAPVPVHFDVGNFGHTYAERLIPSLPKGLDREVWVLLPDGATKRLDRVDWTNGIIYEVKPSTKRSIEQGKKQVKLYVEYMNRENPLGKGRKWQGVVVTYDQKAVLRLARSIGWLAPKKYAPVKKPSPASQKRARSVFATGIALALHSAAPQPAGAAAPSRMIDDPALMDRATDASQRMNDLPDRQASAAGVNDPQARGVGQARSPLVPGKPAVVPPASSAQPATTGPSPPAAPIPPASQVSKTGTYSVGRVAVDYDLRGGTKPNSLKLKSVDLSDFFKETSSKIRAVRNNPMTRQLAAAGKGAAANYLTSWGLGKIKSYFSGLISEATRNFERHYPAVDVLLDDAEIDQHQATFDAIAGEDPAWSLNMPHKERMLAIAGLFDYEEAVIELNRRVATLTMEIPPIYMDISVRRNILFKIGQDLEDAFVFIHTHAIGALLPVYYASFELWSIRVIFKELADEMSELTLLIHSRQGEYERLIENLDKKLHDASPQLEYWRRYYDKNKHVLD